MWSYGAIMTFQCLFQVTGPDWRWTSLCACENLSLSAMVHSVCCTAHQGFCPHKYPGLKTKTRELDRKCLVSPETSTSDPTQIQSQRFGGGVLDKGPKDPGEGVLGFQEKKEKSIGQTNLHTARRFEVRDKSRERMINRMIERRTDKQTEGQNKRRMDGWIE